MPTAYTLATRSVFDNWADYQNPPTASAFSVADLTWDNTSLHAVAGRDLAYSREAAALPSDSSQFPHRRDGLIIIADNRIQVPNSRLLRSQIIEHFHKVLNHGGAAKVTAALKQQFSWTGMDADVKLLLKTCAACQLTKTGNAVARSLKTFTVDTGPWQTIHVDITMLYHGLAEDAISSAVIVVDRFSRFTVLIPCTHALSAESMFALLDAHLFAYYGLPQRIISDNGPPFSSTYWDTVLEHLGTRRGKTTVYRPETNGLVERMNRTVKDMLRTVSADLKLKGPEDIRKALPWVMWAINATENRTIGMSPFEASTLGPPYIPQGFTHTPPSSGAAEDRIQHAARIWKHVRAQLIAYNPKDRRHR